MSAAADLPTPVVRRIVGTEPDLSTPDKEGIYDVTYPSSDDRHETREGKELGDNRDQPLPAHLISSAVEEAFRRLQAGDVQMVGLPVPSQPEPSSA